MRKSIFMLAALFCATLATTAQEAAEPAIEIPLTAYISAETNLTPEAESLLLNRMRQAALKNGLAAVDNQPYIVTTSVNVIDKQLTGTVPQKWLVEVEAHFFIGNGVDGTLYASTAINRKGIGDTEEKAYMSAIKAISANDRAFKPFFEKGKERIIAELMALAALQEAQEQAEKEAQEEADANVGATVSPSPAEPAETQPLQYQFNWQ